MDVSCFISGLVKAPISSLSVSAGDPGLSVDADGLAEVQSGVSPTADGKTLTKLIY